jgi:hypothetical protein
MTLLQLIGATFLMVSGGHFFTSAYRSTGRRAHMDLEAAD